MHQRVSSRVLLSMHNKTVLLTKVSLRRQNIDFHTIIDTFKKRQV